MKVNIPVNSTDAVILIILAVLFARGVRIVIGFFKKPEKKDPDAGKHREGREEAAEEQLVTVHIDGMMCGMCEAHIKDAIRECLPAAKHVSASAGRGEAAFILDKKNTKPAAELLTKLHEKIDPLGYDVQDLQIKEESA